MHDEHRADPSLAFALSRLADQPTTPTPIGVFRAVEPSDLRGRDAAPAGRRPSAKGPGDLERLAPLRPDLDGRLSERGGAGHPGGGASGSEGPGPNPARRAKSGRACTRRGTDEFAGGDVVPCVTTSRLTKRHSPASPSSIGVSCTCTATGCSRRSTRRRMPFKRRSCVRGVRSKPSPVTRSFVPGCTASRRTCASTSCGGGDARPRLARWRGWSPIRTGCSTSSNNLTRGDRARDDRARVPRRAGGAPAEQRAAGDLP